jgi:hypothetical protein
MPTTPNTPQAKASPEPTGAAPNAPGAASGDVTPQEQQAYEKVVLAGMKVLYDKSTHAGIVNMLRSGDPAEAIANVVTTVMAQLDKKSGGKIPETVILPAAAEILEDTAQLAGKIGIQVDERVTGQAMQRMVMGLAEEYGVTPEEVQEIMQAIPKEEVQKMVQQQSGFSQQTQPQAAAPAAQPAAPMGA